MQHGYRKSNYCKRIIRRFVVKCGQIKKPPCESKWKIPVKLRDTPCTARERIPSLPGCRPIKQQKWTPLQVNLQGVYFHHFAWLVAFTKFSQKNQHLPLGSFGVVLSCGVRARKALFYKAFAGSYFLSGSVKNRHFLRKWCSKWCSKIVVEVKKQKIEKTSEKSLCLIKLIL